MVPCPVVTLKDPLACTAIRPVYLPAFLPLGTTARMRSPVLKPLTRLCCLARVRGKPYLSMSVIWRHCQPIAWISNGRTCRTRHLCGVLAPTHAASKKCVFGRPALMRWYLVLPPVPTSTGTPVAWRCLYSAHLVLVLAAVSRKGI